MGRKRYKKRERREKNKTKNENRIITAILFLFNMNAILEALKIRGRIH